MKGKHFIFSGILVAIPIIIWVWNFRSFDFLRPHESNVPKSLKAKNLFGSMDGRASSNQAAQNGSGDSTAGVELSGDSSRHSSKQGPFDGESVLITGDAISLGKAKALFDNKNFPSLLKGFQLKYSGDPEAQSLKKIYFSELNRQLSKRDDIRGVDFECGVTVCVGALRIGGGFDDPDLVGNVLGKSNPVYGLIETSVVVDGMTEKRFFFSVDPQVHSISSN
ncbi:hypothetical protein NRY95_07230 [Xanthomonas campestris pv. phormiicola]|nr:hypothetical protein [Xanthomonas campestris pv. phormiicola]UYC17736.1 hypothetical protein NRY95_07230 [Xanthomonas campestris pv. phormiicola]